MRVEKRVVVGVMSRWGRQSMSDWPDAVVLNISADTVDLALTFPDLFSVRLFDAKLPLQVKSYHEVKK